MPSGGDTQQRFVYSTVDQHGEIAASTAAVFFPTGEAPEGGWPALAWAHGTTGMGDNCTPSAGSRNDKVLVDHWVDAGYAVVASDYTGIGTPGLMSYFNGEATAVSVVDSVIAAQKLDSVGAQLSEKWAVAGQSQGGVAALHVAHKASARSVEVGLDYRGAVATGAPAYVEELVLAGSPSFPPVALPDTLNAYVAYILAGFREAHPEVDLSSALTPEGRRVADLAETMCLDEMSENLSGKVLSGLFNRPLREVPGFAAALRDYMTTPTDGYDKPVFLGHGLTDIDVPSPIGVALNSEMWVRQFTGGNEQVEVHRYPTDHSGAMLASVADSTPFLQRIMG
ncbi:alpha/beta hydrolase [Corynebacterium variabile]|uniref:alpha/beta hydrolase n=1 Tax=Corynebacterium variabile TaxID=1727 RepID=UPI003FD4D61C